MSELPEFECKKIIGAHVVCTLVTIIIEVFNVARRTVSMIFREYNNSKEKKIYIL